MTLGSSKANNASNTYPEDATSLFLCSKAKAAAFYFPQLQRFAASQGRRPGSLPSMRGFEIVGRSGRLIDQAVVDGVECELQAVGDAQFVENVVQVIFYGLLA